MPFGSVSQLSVFYVELSSICSSILFSSSSLSRIHLPCDFCLPDYECTYTDFSLDAAGHAGQALGYVAFLYPLSYLLFTLSATLLAPKLPGIPLSPLLIWLYRCVLPGQLVGI